MTPTSRQRIERVAADILARDGYNGMGLKALSQASSLPYGSIYHHFPGGKEDIAVAAIRTRGVWIAGLIEQGFAKGVTRPAMRAMFAFMADRLERSEWLDGCAIGTPALDGSSDSARIRAACDAAFTSMIDPIATALARMGLSRGGARDLATTIMATYEGAMMLARVQQSRAPMKAAAESMIRLVEASFPSHVRTPDLGI